MALSSPELREFRGENADQLNTLAVTVLNLVNYANHLEGRVAALEDAEPADAEASPKAPAQTRRTASQK